MIKDTVFMQRCIDLAQKGLGHVSPNPMVGAGLVHNNRIIGEGWHKKYGGPHAEINALSSVGQEDKSKIAESTLYVSLEPCNHYGLTPPCVDRILQEKIKRVVIGCLDPNPLTKGKSIEKLCKAGVSVEVGVLEDQCIELIRVFSVNSIHGRPFIVIKWAESKQGFIGQEGKQIWLTNQFSKTLAHKWRSFFDAIVIGWKTLETDRPQLTNRLYFGSSPIGIVIDYKLKCNLNDKPLDDKGKLLIINTLRSRTSGNNRYVKFDEAIPFRQQFCAFCLREKLFSILVEGGSQTHQRFIDLDLWDEAWIFSANMEMDNGIQSATYEGQLKAQTSIVSDALKIYKRLL